VRPWGLGVGVGRCQGWSRARMAITAVVMALVQGVASMGTVQTK
jgi:hypothetical protein